MRNGNYRQTGTETPATDDRMTSTRHRLEDVRKVKAEVRRAGMENLRLASRLVNDEREASDIEQKIVVDKGPTISEADDA